jgi:intein-encoded DNA endonuclease-like protein
MTLTTAFNTLVSPSYYRIGVNYAFSLNDEKLARQALQEYIDNLDYVAPASEHEHLKKYWSNEFYRQFDKIFVYCQDSTQHITAPF